jgi:hypothetical protein
LTSAGKPAITAYAGFYPGEMGEWLKALALKVLPEPRKPYKSRVSPMFSIGVLVYLRSWHKMSGVVSLILGHMNSNKRSENWHI